MSGNFDSYSNIGNYSPKVGQQKQVGEMNSTEAVSMGLMSVFDSNWKNEGEQGFSDGKVSKQEFSKISEEQYNNYVAQIKMELSKEQGKNAVKNMNIPSYKEYAELVKNGDIDFATMENFIKSANECVNTLSSSEEPPKADSPEVMEAPQNILNERLDAASAIVAKTDFKSLPAGTTPKAVINNMIEGKDENFNSACADAQKAFESFDADKNNILSLEEQDNYLKSTPEGAKAAEKYESSDTDKDKQLSGDEFSNYFNQAIYSNTQEQKALFQRYLFHSSIDKESQHPKTQSELIVDIYDDKKNSKDE